MNASTGAKPYSAEVGSHHQKLDFYVVQSVPADVSHLCAYMLFFMQKGKSTDNKFLE